MWCEMATIKLQESQIEGRSWIKKRRDIYPICPELVSFANSTLRAMSDFLILLWQTPDDFTRQGEPCQTGKGRGNRKHLSRKVFRELLIGPGRKS